MAPLVWFTVGLAIWHLVVFVPDRFRGGIVGAFIGAAAGAMVTGAIAQALTGATLGETSLATVLYPIPGTLAGLAVVYKLGVRAEDAAEAQAQ